MRRAVRARPHGVAGGERYECAAAYPDVRAARSLCSLSHRERGGVRGYGLSMGFGPPHPNPLPAGEREHTEHAERASPHSITSSARASPLGGTPRPIAFAVLRLMTSSYLVGACTRRSASLSPLWMR